MDGSPWVSKELYAAFLVAIAVTIAGLWLVLRLRRGRGAPLRHVVRADWTPVVLHLAAARVPPARIALALAGHPLDLGAGPVRAPLPAAVATTADALGLALPDLQQDVVREGTEPAAVEALRALGPALAAAPGVAAVGALWPDDPAALASAVRAYGKLAGVRPASAV